MYSDGKSWHTQNILVKMQGYLLVFDANHRMIL